MAYKEKHNIKHRTPIGIEDNSIEAGAITNICIELIERIFDLLDHESLLNVAGTCKRLQIAASAMYGRKFGGSHTTLCLKSVAEGSLPKQGSRFKFEHNAVEVYHRTVLPFLRCFGAHITALSVRGRDNDSHTARYINQFCADTLTEMTIYDYYKEAFTMESFPRPFKMVETVFLLDLDEQFSNFAYWFPGIRKLRFTVRRFDFDVSSAVFPHLEELSCSALLKSYSERRRLERFVRANQQLRYLRFNVEKSRFSRLLEMLSGHTFISKLVVGTLRANVNNKHVKRAQLLRFAREHPEVVEIDVSVFLLKADDAVALIRELSSLKSFRCRLKDLAEYHNFENQLQHVMGFMFEAFFDEIFTPTITVLLKFNR